MSNKLIIGYFGYHSNKLDGQTVKTRSFYNILKEMNNTVNFFDTEEVKVNKLSLIKLFYFILTSRKIYFFPAHNSLKSFFPILFQLSRVFNIQLSYFMIGGWLTEFLKKNPKIKDKLGRIDKIYCETYTIKKELYNEFGFTNLDYFPNFREVDFKPRFNKVDNTHLKMVYMGRINESKGILDLFELEKYLQSKNIINYSIHLYGQIQDNFKSKFENELRNTNYINYKGVLQPSEIHATLVNYDLMLFPTHNYTEGLPGTVLDAYLSGIPVIASNWKHALEYIDINETGFIYKFNDNQDLFNQVKNILKETSIIATMKSKAWQKSSQYTKRYALELLNKIIK